MGNWDRELIELLPKAVKVYASAGAGFDWVDTEILAEHGEFQMLSPGKRDSVCVGLWSRWLIGEIKWETWDFGKIRG